MDNKIISDFERVYTNALTLYENDYEKAYEWLTTPNSHFYNFSPMKMILAGKGKRIYEKQEELLGDK